MKDGKHDERKPAPHGDDKPEAPVKTETPGPRDSRTADAPPAAGAAAVPATETKPESAELADLKDRFLRLSADFDNFRKRTVRDREDHRQRAAEAIFRDLLPVIDHFEMGLEEARKQNVPAAVLDGLALVQSQLLAVLEKAGVKIIHTEGELFDPKIHECVAHEHTDAVPENIVMRETRRGYRIGKFLLRAPQVIVSSRAAGPGSEQDAMSAGHSSEAQDAEGGET